MGTPTQLKAFTIGADELRHLLRGGEIHVTDTCRFVLSDIGFEKARRILDAAINDCIDGNNKLGEVMVIGND